MHLSKEIVSPGASALSTPDYVRQRLRPNLRDLNYLHLTDLASLIRQVASKAQGKVFDYGCGGAPYRSLFANCKRYIAADLQAGPSVDLVLQPNGTTAEPDESYDLVISTQVLEHVQNPDDYLRECYRILRTDGQLLLSTHGMFEEHGCPYDFQRWTSRGLEELVSKNSFAVFESGKLTTELRAFVQLTNQMSLHWRCPEKPLLHRFLAFLRKAYCLFGTPCLNWVAGMCSHQAIVPASHPASLYVCVYVRAVKH